MLRKHMHDEKLREFRGVDHVASRDEDRLLSEPIDNHENHGMSGRCQELLNEVHGDRIPVSRRDGQWLESSVRFVTSRLVSSTSDA